MLNAKMMINEQFNGIEIYFSNKPKTEIREELKSNGFKWHNQKKCWYAKNTPARMTIAMNYATTNTAEAAAIAEAETEPKINEYGVKVGDIFSASWGYEQTNIDFFQVIEMVGQKSVRVREVRPQVLQTEYHSDLAWDSTYKLTGELLPPAPFSVFVKNQEKGDLKRLDKWGDRVCFRLSSYAHAFKEENDIITKYESHYA